MPQTRFTLPVAVFLILVKDDKVLLHRRQNTHWYDGSYDLPSGHLDGDESLAAALCREAREEVGIGIALPDAKFTTFFHSFFPEDGKEYIYVFFEVTRWEGEPAIMEPDKCDEVRWFALDELPDNLTPGTRDGLRAYRQKTVFAESGL